MPPRMRGGDRNELQMLDVFLPEKVFTMLAQTTQVCMSNTTDTKFILEDSGTADYSKDTKKEQI
jgi:hypothetical protein